MRFVWLAIGLLAAAGAELPAAADEVELVTGEHLRGRLVQQDQKSVVLDHPVLGRLEIASDQVKAVHIETAETSESPSESSPDLPPKSSQAPMVADEQNKPSSSPSLHPSTAQNLQEPSPYFLIDGWESQLELSFDGKEGNSPSTSLRLAFKTNRQTDHSVLRFDSKLLLASRNNETTTEEFTAGGRVEWPLLSNEALFYFGEGRFDYNLFRPWDYRIGGGAGLGVRVIDHNKFKLITRGGGGGVKEFGDFSDDFRAEGLAGAEVRWKINGMLSVEVDSTYYPDLSGPNESRVVSAAALIIKLNHGRRFNLKFGIDHEYESTTPDDSKHNEFHYFGALLFGF